MIRVGYDFKTKFRIENSYNLADNSKFVPFGVKNLVRYIYKKNTVLLIELLLNHIPWKMKQKILNCPHIYQKLNYFQFNEKVYSTRKGLVVLAETFIDIEETIPFYSNINGLV